MLIGAFQIHIGGTMEILTGFADGSMAYTRLPPNVQNVFIGFQVINTGTAVRTAGICRQEFSGLLAIPRIGTFGLEEIDNRIECCFGCYGFTAGIASKYWNRNAPIALTADT